MAAKQVIVVRKDLNMRKGKVGAQAAHACLAVVLDKGPIDAEIMQSWRLNGHKKICVYVNSEEELLEVYQKGCNAKLPTALITDRGDTEFRGIPTKTCCAIGPADEAQVDKITGDLPLY